MKILEKVELENIPKIIKERRWYEKSINKYLRFGFGIVIVERICSFT